MDKRYKGSWSATENAGRADVQAVADFERDYSAARVAVCSSTMPRGSPRQQKRREDIGDL